MRSHTDGYAVMIYLFRFVLCDARSSDVDLGCDFRPYNVGIDLIYLINKSSITKPMTQHKIIN